MKKLLFILATTFSLYCHSQIVFEKGYFIRNSGEKTEALIKNLEWYNNPTKFIYKSSENAPEAEITILDVKEFGIYNAKKYVKSTLNVDRSSEGLTNLTSQKEAVFKEETLFLEVLVEGKASLYFYKDDVIEKYFYSKEKGAIAQLINKNYLTMPYKTIASNKQYLVQLWNDLKCAEVSMKMVEKVEYSEDDLTKFFVKYNQCNNSEAVVLEKKVKRDWFNLTVRPGVTYNSLKLENFIYDIEFDNRVNFRLGVEAEIVMAFNKGKWALVVEPCYMAYNSEATYYYGSSTPSEASVDYKAIEIPLGVRHYFFLNPDSKIFLNAFLVPEINLGSSLLYNNNHSDFSINSGITFAAGIGYKFKKYSVEFRQTFGKNIITRYEPSWKSNLSTSALILGYTIF